ncbi:MAG TPA: hypothetical protein VIG74_01500 [Alphaproteobacteria bacterium]|jgi:outer membrane murein-binding lipoprotein Lpp
MNNQKLVIAIVIAAVIALAGGYMYAQKKQDDKSISLTVGDKTISATVE